MKVVYLIADLDLRGEPPRSLISQANALSKRHDVEILSLYKSAERPYFRVAPRVKVRHLISLQDGRVRTLERKAYSERDVQTLHAATSVLLPQPWATGYSSLTDLEMESVLSDLKADVLITFSPILLAYAVRFTRSSVAVIHQEHRASQLSAVRREALIAYAPQADAVTVLNETEATWMRGQLGAAAPPVQSIPHPLPAEFRPTSRLNGQTIVAMGPLAADKGFADLIRAFALISDQLPGWRLRIFGKGPRRAVLERIARRLKLFDRVEFPGTTVDIPSEWAKASVAAVTSHAEGMPLAAQEAMAAGVPVVSYDCPSGPRELISHERNGLLVPPESVTALASALLHVARNDRLRASLGDNALDASRHFDAEVIAECWERLFAFVADSHHNRARSRLARRADALLADEYGDRAGSVEAPIASEVQRSSPSREDTLIPPPSARSIALAWAVETAQRSSNFWFVIPPTATRAQPTVVVPADRRKPFLDLLDRPGCPAPLVLRDEAGHGWPETSGPVAHVAPRLGRGAPAQIGLQLGTITGPSGQGCSILVEFWDSVNGSLLAPEPNMYATRVPSVLQTRPAEIEGVEVRTLPLMDESTVFDRDFPVDAVYTWVDGADPAWAARRELRLAELQTPTPRVEARGSGRYTSRDELKYSLRSVHYFAPWIRQIFLVTDRQVPTWLDTDFPHVKVVDHSEILDRQSLPTFNSHAIETGLHHIDGLSEQFIYFNDDVFLARPMRKADFFSTSGQPGTFLAPHQPVGFEDPEEKPHLLAAFNNRRILQQDFGRTVLSTLLHTPHPLTRSLVSEVEQRYRDQFRRTARTPFRSASDISPLTSLVQHYAVLTGKGYVGDLTSRFVTLNSTELNETLARLLANREIDTFCLADYHEYVLSAARVNELVDNFLKSFFPVAAPWEAAPTEGSGTI